MKTLAWLGCFALLFSLAALADGPKFGWKQTSSESFSLNATEFRYYPISPSGRWRFTFKADAAIDVGVLSAEQFQRQNKKHLFRTTFTEFACVKTSILEADVPCDVQSNAQLAIRDKRGPITKAVGAYSAVKPLGGSGSGAIADRATSPNKVTLTFYRWVCLENCPK
jgi:hypothetical protein